MTQLRLFRFRHYHAEIILLCVRWYLRYSLSYRDQEEMMAERGLSVDHTTIYRCVQYYAPIFEKKCRARLNAVNDSWRVDETYVKVKGNWMYLYRAVDSDGNTVEYGSAQPEMLNQPGTLWVPSSSKHYESSILCLCL
jgi:transposase, IS6 family